jgi:glycosyltransferase involved in cell wall biosynthesis
MIALFQRTLAPYRVSLFNCLSEALDGQFTLVLSRRDPTPDRQWTIPWPQVRFRVTVLPGHRINTGRGTLELSRGVRAVLDDLCPDVIVLGGWDVHASWAAASWARRRGVPMVAWAESSQGTGRHRDVVSTAIRRRFLSACSAAIVPGAAAEAFVRALAPALPCYFAPNSLDAADLRAIDPPPPHGAALFVGELSERKGCDLILAAAGDLLALYPSLIIAGDGPLRPEAVALAARLPGVEYAGFVEGEEKTALFRRSSVVLLPSRRDPWPLVACEALVGRRPVVLGPGVGSVADLRRVAGDAVAAMTAATPGELKEAAGRLKGQVVPPELRSAFAPPAVAASMAAAARSVIRPVTTSASPRPPARVAPAGAPGRKADR